MGTSQSKRDAGPGRPLVPPWADQDPATPPADADGAPQAAPTPPALPAAGAAAGVTPARRFSAFRTALGKFAASGDRAEARKALGHWARTATGGSGAGVARIARAARTGGAAIAGFGQAATGQAPTAGGFDVRSCAGLPVQAAIDRIVDAFCPAGILDEDLARMAIGEALAVALEGADTFDPAAIDERTVQVATLTFAAELVFLQISGEAGASLAAAPTPAMAVQREADLRALVREVVDVMGTPILQAAGNFLTPQGMAGLVSQLVGAVEAEMESW